MNELRNGVNTRLQTKREFDDFKSSFFDMRSNQDKNIIQPLNQDKLIDFHNFTEKKLEETDKIEDKVYQNFTIDSGEVCKSTPFTQIVKESDAGSTVNYNKPSYDTNVQNHHQTNDITNIGIEASNYKPDFNNVKFTKNTDEQQNISFEYKPVSLYIPEISNKRKLINILLSVLEKRNIETTDRILEEYISRYNISYENPDPNILSQLINDIKTPPKKETTNLTDVDFDEETIEVSFLVSIDSRDRDLTKWPNPNEYKIDFAPETLRGDNIKGYISRSFDNVVSVQLISAIFPKNIDKGNNIEDYPYIILEVDELGSNYETTNDNSTNAFAQLTFDLDTGKYKKLIARNDYEYNKKFHPRISLNKFTIRIKTPTGEPYNFGEKYEESIESTSIVQNTEQPNKEHNYRYDPNNLDLFNKPEIEVPVEQPTSDILCDIYPPVNFIFKITCIQRKLDNMYLNRRDS